MDTHESWEVKNGGSFRKLKSHEHAISRMVFDWRPSRTARRGAPGVAAQFFAVVGERRREAGADLRLVIERDGRELVLEEGIAEAVQRRAREAGGVVATVFEHGDDFLEKQCLEPRADLGMLDSLAHGFDAERQRVGDERGCARR